MLYESLKCIKIWVVSSYFSLEFDEFPVYNWIDISLLVTTLFWKRFCTGTSYVRNIWTRHLKGIWNLKKTKLKNVQVLDTLIQT